MPTRPPYLVHSSSTFFDCNPNLKIYVQSLSELGDYLYSNAWSELPLATRDY